ncbi:MAG: efflux transporter periplasmic adaptor subunit, partial [Pacificimonas sp.]
LLGSGYYQALLVPAEAIVTDQSRRLVYTVNGKNEIATREVVTGPMVEGLRVIRDGLAPTERIVMDGLTRVQPGMKVTPQDGEIETRDGEQSPTAQAAEPPDPASAQTGGQ